MHLSWKTGWVCLLLAMQFWVAAAETLDTIQPAIQIPPIPKVETSVAYPGGSLYLSRGIFASLAGGQHKNYSQSQNLYQWQGEVSYYYTSWFSGGAGFKMIAGQPSDASQLIRNRFFIVSRFHKSWSKVSTYLGAQIGMDDLNVSLSPLDTGNFRQPLSDLNAGMGLELGAGWKFSRFVGATFAQRFEASLVGEATDSAKTSSINFHISPGIALDILAFAPPLRKNVKACYAFTELQFGQLLLVGRSSRRDFSWITGLSFAF